MSQGGRLSRLQRLILERRWIVLSAVAQMHQGTWVDLCSVHRLDPSQPPTDDGSAMETVVSWSVNWTNSLRSGSESD